MDRSPSNPSVLSAEQRRVRAAELRKLGMGYQAIARALDISPSQARRDVLHMLRRWARHDLKEVEPQRQLELERIEMVLAALAPKVREGDPAAIDRWLKACTVRRQLLGLDAESTSSDRDIIKFLHESVIDP